MRKALIVIGIIIAIPIVYVIGFALLLFGTGVADNLWGCDNDSSCKLNERCEPVFRAGEGMFSNSFQGCAKITCAPGEIIVSCGGRNYQLNDFDGTPMYTNEIRKLGYHDETGHFCIKPEDFDKRNEDSMRIYNNPCTKYSGN